MLFSSETTIDVLYKSFHLDTALRADFLIGHFLVIKIKAIDSILLIHWRNFSTIRNY
ncbi:GxxExxY protein [Dyadobacter koreensis]|uniref:GxxExxY protein n=1 Tax=Dyadobacter koreensis TaxID=408657 RepID=UPI000B835864